jgi:hypothetical protein
MKTLWITALGLSSEIQVDAEELLFEAQEVGFVRMAKAEALAEQKKYTSAITLLKTIQEDFPGLECSYSAADLERQFEEILKRK